MLLHILSRDLKILLSERRTLLVIIAMPIVLTTILSFALSSSFSDDPAIEQFEIGVVQKYTPGQGVVDFENQITSNLLAGMLNGGDPATLVKQAQDLNVHKLFMEDLLGNEDIKDIMVSTVMTQEDALQRLDNGDLAAVVILPENFESSAYINLLTTLQSPVEIEILRNPDMNISSGIASQIIESFFSQMTDQAIGKNVLIQSGIQVGDTEGISKAITALFDNVSGKESIAIDLQSANERPVIDSRTYYSISMMTLFLLFSAGRGSYLLLTEKRNYTWHRMLVAGVNRYAILAGKFAVVFGLAVLQILALILYSSLVLGVQWGDPVSLGVVTLFTALAIAALGTFFAALTFLSENTRIANLMESVVFQVLGLLGGAYIPVSVLPKALQALSSFPLNGVALKAYLNIATGNGLGDIGNYLLILLGNALVFGVLAIMVLNREGGKTHVDNPKAQTAVS